MTTTTTQTILWQGASGTEHKYWIHPVGTIFDKKPGNYIFCREVSPGRFQPIYIGETGDLSERFDHHHKGACIARNGATHIHAHTTEGGDVVRRREESDLITQWNPTCNG